MKKTLLVFLSVLLAGVLGYAETIDLSFTNIGTEGWKNSYDAHTYETDAYTVAFTGFSKQTRTVTDVPVAKDGNIVVTLKGGATFATVQFNFRQWSTRKNTVNLKYSTDGVTFNDFSPAISGQTTDNNNSISANTIPEGVVAIKMTATQSGKNQFGVASIEYTVVGGLKDPELTFTNETVTANLGEAVSENTLNNPHNVSVAYTSSKPAVAEVDETTGVVTIKSAGRTTITATSTETEEYSAGTASYILRVVDPNALSPVLLTDINKLDGAKGYIVCNTKGVAMGGLSEDIYSSISEAVFSDDKSELTEIPDGALELTFTKTADGYAISYDSAEGATVYMNSTEVKKMSESETEISASVTVAEDGTATVNYSVGTLKYNPSAPRFTTYTSGQNAIQIYIVPKPEFTQELSFSKSAGDSEAGTVSLKYSVTVSGTNAEPEFTLVVTDLDGNVVEGVTIENIPDATPAAAPALRAIAGKTYEGTIVATSDAFKSSGVEYNFDLTAKVGDITSNSVVSVPTAVDDILVETAAEAVYYDLTGRVVENPAGGLYIRVAGGKASKVYVR